MEKQKKQSLVAAPGGKSYLVPFILITSLFLLWGFAHGLLDVLNKHFQGVFTMTKAESGLVQFSTYIAYFLMPLRSGSGRPQYRRIRIRRRLQDTKPASDHKQGDQERRSRMQKSRRDKPKSSDSEQ